MPYTKEWKGITHWYSAENVLFSEERLCGDKTLRRSK